MFTGIVEEIGVVKAIAKGTHSIKLSIKATDRYGSYEHESGEV